MSESKVCVVVGVGPGNGEAFARRFAEGGYRVALLARSEEPARALAEELGGKSYRCDVTDTEQLREVLGRIAGELGPIDVLLYNAGSGVFGDLEAVDEETMRVAWEVNVLGLFTAAKTVAPTMKERGGAILVTGATASLRGGARFAAFASAKGAQRNLVQSMARHLQPEGVHVALVIVDGMVDLPRTRKMAPDMETEAFLQPSAIAESVWYLAHQPKSAWTLELDVRPHLEKF
ncbi:MAG: SDR family NAD(P)-dependent oxidoreductase [Deltaproteobacteria bacterium]|nr:SDR family NAD(P)-dependent oxidoreductase [Deltaproteobacteria bacterium]